MIVIIKKSTRSSYWYADKIGKAFEVFPNPYYDGVGKSFVCKKDTSKYIDINDCVNIEEIKKGLKVNYISKEHSKRYSEIEKVVFNYFDTVVILKDGRKGVATCSYDDLFNEETGFWCAYAKALKCHKPLNIKIIPQTGLTETWNDVISFYDEYFEEFKKEQLEMISKK